MAESKISEIKIRVLKQELIEWKALHWMQGNLKQMTEAQCEKLTQYVLTKNILKPFHVWEHDGKLWCLDGNHLRKVLELIEQKKLAKIPDKLPAVFIDCENEKEAADCVLTYSAVYTSIVDEGLYEFIHQYELQDEIPDLLKRIEIPGYDLQRFVDGYIFDEQLEQDKYPFGDTDNINYDDGYVQFRFGDYGGKVNSKIYDSFVLKYKSMQSETGEIMLDNILSEWLNV
jgi:hypothetical protein